MISKPLIAKIYLITDVFEITSLSHPAEFWYKRADLQRSGNFLCIFLDNVKRRKISLVNSPNRKKGLDMESGFGLINSYGITQHAENANIYLIIWIIFSQWNIKWWNGCRW